MFHQNAPHTSNERLWELYQQGLSFRTIQVRTGRSYLQIRDVIRERHKAEDLPVPNFRIKRDITFANAWTGKASRVALVSTS